MAAVSLMVGSLCLALGKTLRFALLSPGPLSSHHASIDSGLSHQTQCSACHAAAQESPSQWLADALRVSRAGTESHTAPSDMSTRCLSCHKTELSQFAVSPHSIPPRELARLTAERYPPSPSHDETTQLAARRSAISGTGVECSGCHHEHQGTDQVLTQVADAQCATCHQQQFNRFGDGHPEFQHWPPHDEEGIRFTHQVHESKYFPEAKQNFACRDCHVATETTSVQRSMSYAQCTSCHDAALRVGTLEGVRWWQLPILPRETIAASTGQDFRWPELATGDFDGPLPLLMQLLLAQDPSAAQILNRRGTTLDFFDFDEDVPQDLQDAATLATSIVELAHQLREDPTAVLRSKLANSMTPHRREDLVEPLVQGIPELEVSRAMDKWFSLKTTGEARGTWEGKSSESEAEPGWHVDFASGTIRYRPMGHADPVLRALIDALTHPTNANSATTATIMDKLGQSHVVQQCTVCHQRQSTGEVVWNVPMAESVVEFTRFRHGPHVTTASSTECRQCHRDETKAAARHDFASMKKSTCTACHQKHLAGESCTQCHGYHVQEWQSAFTRLHPTEEVRTATQPQGQRGPTTRQQLD